MDPAQPLRQLQKKHDFLVAIDSDGCAFDTMEIKHKECFIPNIIKFWGLQAVSKYAREASEFVNLYSRERGVNRWPALIKAFELLEERPEVMERRDAFFDYSRLADFIHSGKKLSNAGVQEMIDETGEEIFHRALAWSEAVNADIAAMVHGVPPFPHMRQSLEKVVPLADVIVCSATPCEALEKEWTEHDIARYAAVIAGQEMGSKKEHLALVCDGRYAPGPVLMIGDALGDMKAAQANGALFYPVNPGGEAASWGRFASEAADRFFAGTFAGDYQQALIDEFMGFLPENPPWKSNDKP